MEKDAVDYKKMDQAERLINIDREVTEVKEHIHKTPHTKEDIEV